MHIVIAGGTGFLGRPLVAQLRNEGHDLTILTRRSGPSAAASAERTSGGARLVRWIPDGTAGGGWAAALDGADAVINLAGEPIAGGRWTADKKRRIRESRIAATRSLSAAIAVVASPPAVFVSGSAVGYYGACGHEVVTESHPAGDDFLADVCIRWEREAMTAATARTRVVCIRTGLVLAADGGALSAMLPPFRLGIGGRLGSGRQYMPWIHRQDWLNLISFTATRDAVAGALNATAPTPVTNAEFTQTLARVLRRPAFLPAPAIALRLVLGEMADSLLLSGQRAVPAAAEALGFKYAYPALEPALREVTSR